MDFETLGQLWPLQSGNTNQPTLTAGKQTTFQHNDVPDRCPSGPLAYYLPGDIVTFRGSAVQAGGEGATTWDSEQVMFMLFSTLAWIQAWHGSPLQAQNITGAHWNAIEFFANGFRYEQAPHQVIPAGAGTYPFEISIFVPFNCCRIGDLEEDTSQLALLARSSQLQLVAGPLGIGTVTLTGVSATASSVLVPRQDLVLGTPVEDVLSQIVAGPGNAIKITGFGTDSGINGIDPGGGVLALWNFTNANGQDGSFNAVDLTNYQFNWRGQQQTQDILGLFAQWRRLLPTPLDGTITGAWGSANMVGFPYPNTNGATNSPAVNPNAELQNLLIWPMVLPGKRPRLTSLQTADSDQTVNMTVTGGFTGSHQIHGKFARSWQERMVANWIGQVTAGNSGSLAAYVLGPNYTKAQPTRRAPAKHSFSNDQLRYLPWQLSL